MKLMQKILIKLNGLHYSQEYLCFASESMPYKLRMYLVQEQMVIREVTDSHLFVGYCPLVFAFANAGMPDSIQLILSNRALQPNEKFNTKDAIALLKMDSVKKQEHGSSLFVYYEGRSGMHHFQSAFHQFIGKKYNQWYNKKPGNVFLHDNLYKQVQIAYAVPRLISLITVGGSGWYNLFPTDLHGQAGASHYIISLRTGGYACRQVMAAGRLVLSQMQSEAYTMVYGLGKNHMQELRSADNFPFSSLHSQTFGLPLPQLTASYQELELVDSFTHGIHTLLLFTILNRQQTSSPGNTLVHIHNSYASWRYKNGLQGNFLMR